MNQFQYVTIQDALSQFRTQLKDGQNTFEWFCTQVDETYEVELQNKQKQKSDLRDLKRKVLFTNLLYYYFIKIFNSYFHINKKESFD